MVSRPNLGSALGSLRTPAFRSWFVSQVLSVSGSMTQVVAQSWLVLKLTGSGLELGLLGSSAMLPLLLGGPAAGALVDRVDRRRLLIATQSLFILLAGILAALTFTGAVRVWMLFVLAFATGCVSAPDGAARQVYVLDLVGRERLASAVSLNEVVINLSRVAGPGVGGILLGAAGIPACFVANAVSYVPTLVVLIHHHRRLASRPSPAEPDARRRARGSIRAGLAYAWRTPALRYCLLMAAVSGMLFNLGVALPLLATRTFHLDGAGYGLMMATFGAGGVAGALAAGAGRSMPAGRTVRLLALLTAVAILATATAPAVAMAFAGLAVTGCLSIWFIARANTLAQLRAAPGMRGRVMGIWVMALPGSQPVTSPAVGYTAQVAPRAGFGLAGAALLVAACLGWRSLGDRGEAAGAAARSTPARRTRLRLGRTAPARTSPGDLGSSSRPATSAGHGKGKEAIR